jgi:hypothetical protein
MIYKYPHKKHIELSIDKKVDRNEYIPVLEFSICLMYVCDIPFETISKWTRQSEESVKKILLDFVKGVQ